MVQSTTDTIAGATKEHQRLDALVGQWRTGGRVVASNLGDEVDITGSDSYEWLPGGHFLLHTVNVSIGDEKVYNLEVIGYDPATQRYPTRFFDHQGNSGTYVATISNGVWTFSTEGARAMLVIDPAGSRMYAKWEKLDEDGAWQPWMEMEFTKVE
jgi:hypothetical protein